MNLKDWGSNLLPRDKWPKQLLEISDPPEYLNIIGQTPDFENNKLLCIVGARKYSNYGKEVCEFLIDGLKGTNVVIVSGLALGIDGIAHRGALKAGLKTIAIPGSGLNEKNIYPSSHLNLAKDIVQNGGALISEFPDNFKATPWSFPRRNRIMAGISHAVLVIESEIKSGTLITSKLATEYNRDVLTIPGNIFSKNSEGPHMLLRIGAVPITTPKELLEALKIETETETLKLDFSKCSSDELAILKILSEPKTKDEIIRLIDFDVSKTNSLLSILEIKGFISEKMGEFRLL